MCTPKNLGGVGIRNLSILNRAFILKLAWRLLNDDTSLWSRTIRGKYFPKVNFNEIPYPKNYHSRYWKNIYKAMEKIKEVSFWVLGNGRKINFWCDKWIDNLKIGDFVKT